MTQFDGFGDRSVGRSLSLVNTLETGPWITGVTRQPQEREKMES